MDTDSMTQLNTSAAKNSAALGVLEVRNLCLGNSVFFVEIFICIWIEVSIQFTEIQISTVFETDKKKTDKIVFTEQ